jgi:hypothetical protein
MRQIEFCDDPAPLLFLLVIVVDGVVFYLQSCLLSHLINYS